MSDLTPPADPPDERPGPPSGFVDYAAYAPPNVVAPPAEIPGPSRPSTRARRRPRALPVVVMVALGVAVIVGVVLLTRDDTAKETAAEDGPGAAIVAWNKRMAAGDYAGACKLMAARSIAAIEANGPTCAAALATMDPDGLYDRGDEVEVRSVAIDGAEAHVAIRYPGSPLGSQDALAIEEHGVWKASPFTDPGSSGAGTESTEPSGSGNPRTDIAGAGSAECQIEVASVETAVAAYETLTGELPPDTQSLVDRGILRELPEHVAIGSDGTVEPTGDCA